MAGIINPIRVLLISFTCTLFSSCTLIPINFDLPNAPRAVTSIEGELKDVDVRFQSAAYSSGITSQTDITYNWKRSLEKAIYESRWLRDESKNKLDLVVNITKFEASALYFDIDVSAEYVLRNRTDNTILLRKTVTSSGHANDFVGLHRAANVVNDAVRNNIKEFVYQIAK